MRHKKNGRADERDQKISDLDFTPADIDLHALADEAMRRQPFRGRSKRKARAAVINAKRFSAGFIDPELVGLLAVLLIAAALHFVGAGT